MALPCFEMLLNRVLSLSTYEIILSYFSTQSFTAFFIEFIGVTLVNKIIQVAGAQCYNIICTRYCVSTTPSQSPSITIYPPYPLLLPPTHPLLGNHHTLVHVCEMFVFSFLLNRSTPHLALQPPPQLLSACFLRV